MIAPDELRWLRAAAAEAILTRRRRREFVPPALQSALARIDDVLTSGISANGNDDKSDAAHSDSIDINTAAALIGVTPRRVRQLALELGGERVGGRWIFRRAEILEHADGRG